MPKPPISDDGQDNIIETFHRLQSKHNYIPPSDLQDAARRFGYSDTQAYGVASFYSHLSTLPRGKNIIRVCTSAPCMLDGCDELLTALQDLLGIKVGETTADGEFTLESSECVGRCDRAPVMTVNWQPYPEVAPGALPDLIADLRGSNNWGEV